MRKIIMTLFLVLIPSAFCAQDVNKLENWQFSFKVMDIHAKDSYVISVLPNHRAGIIHSDGRKKEVEISPLIYNYLKREIVDKDLWPARAKNNMQKLTMTRMLTFQVSGGNLKAPIIYEVNLSDERRKYRKADDHKVIRWHDYVESVLKSSFQTN